MIQLPGQSIDVDHSWKIRRGWVCVCRFFDLHFENSIKSLNSDSSSLQTLSSSRRCGIFPDHRPQTNPPTPPGPEGEIWYRALGSFLSACCLLTESITCRGSVISPCQATRAECWSSCFSLGPNCVCLPLARRKTNGGDVRTDENDPTCGAAHFDCWI